MLSCGHVIGPGPASRHLVVAHRHHSIYICIGKHLCKGSADQPLHASTFASFDQAPRLIAASPKQSHIVAVVPTGTDHDDFHILDIGGDCWTRKKSALSSPILSMTIGDDLVLYLSATRMAVCRWPSMNPVATLESTAATAVPIPRSRFVVTGHSKFLRQVHVVGTGVVQQAISDRHADDFLDAISFHRMNLVLAASKHCISIISGGKVIGREVLSRICVVGDGESITALTKTGTDSVMVWTTARFLRRFTITGDGNAAVHLVHIGDIQAVSDIIDVVALNLSELLCIRRGRVPAIINLASSEISTDQAQESCSIVGLAATGQRMRFITVSSAGSIRLWDYFTRSCVFQVENEWEEGWVPHVAASPNGFYLCVVVADSVLLYYIVQDGILLHRSWSCAGAAQPHFSHSGHALAVCTKHFVHVLHTLDLALLSVSAKHTSPVSTLAWSPNDQFLATCSGFEVCSIFHPVSGRLISQIRISTSFTDLVFINENTLVAAAINGLQGLALDEHGILQDRGEIISFSRCNINNIAINRIQQKLFLATDSGHLTIIEYGGNQKCFKLVASFPFHESAFCCSVFPESGVVITAGIDGIITDNRFFPNGVDEPLFTNDGCLALIRSSDLDALKSVNQQMRNRVNLLESNAAQQIQMLSTCHLEEVEHVRQELCNIIEEQTRTIQNLSHDLERARAEHLNQLADERDSQEIRFAGLIAHLEAALNQHSKDAAHRERCIRDLIAQHNEEIESLSNCQKNVVENLQVQLESEMLSKTNITNHLERALRESVADYEETLIQLEDEQEFEANENMLESKHALLSKDEQLTKSYADINTLKQRIDVMKYESDRNTFQNEALATELASLSSHTEDLKSVLKESQEVARQRETQIGSMAQDIAQFQAERAALLSVNELLQHKLIGLEDRQKAFPGCVKELNEKIGSMDQELISGIKSLQEMKRISKFREETLEKLKCTALQLEKSLWLKKRQYHSLSHEIRVLVETIHEEKWPQELREIYKSYQLSRAVSSKVDAEFAHSLKTVNDDQIELLQQRKLLTRTVESLQKTVRTEKARSKTEQSKRIKENHELLLEIQELRKKLIMTDLQVKKRPERRPRSVLAISENSNPSRQILLNHKNALLAYRNEQLEDDLEGAHLRIAETAFYRNKLQEALTVALSWADNGSKSRVAEFLQQGELEEPIEHDTFRKRVILPKSASASNLDRRYKPNRKRRQSALINFRFPL